MGPKSLPAAGDRVHDRRMSINEQPAILVGIDGSDDSRNALIWASQLAARTGARIDTIGAWQLSSSYMMPIVGAPLPPTQLFEEAAEQRLALAIEMADLDEAPGQSIVCGHAGAVIVERSSKYDLVVLGRTGRGRLERMFVGSTARHVARHAHCPVALTDTAAFADRVTVAVDGSANSIGALRWAADLGDGVAINAVLAHDERILEDLPLHHEMRVDLDQRAEATLTKAVEESGVDDDRVTIELREGDPRMMIVDTASTDELLVLGGFGHSLLAGMVGSLAGYAIEHAPTQLVVWRD